MYVNVQQKIGHSPVWSCTTVMNNHEVLHFSINVPLCYIKACMVCQTFIYIVNTGGVLAVADTVYEVGWEGSSLHPPKSATVSLVAWHKLLYMWQCHSLGVQNRRHNTLAIKCIENLSSCGDPKTMQQPICPRLFALVR